MDRLFIGEFVNERQVESEHDVFGPQPELADRNVHEPRPNDAK
jgi:hypothetical protein